ncbi:MAG: BPSL0761 family protein [Burkholderiaceae bacterium]
MITPEEWIRAIFLAREFLATLADSRAVGVPESIQHQAEYLLRHYPGPEDMAVKRGARSFIGIGTIAKVVE